MKTDTTTFNKVSLIQKKLPLESLTKETHEKIVIKWYLVIAMAYAHIAALYGAYLSVTSALFLTTLFGILLVFWSGIGITVGAHRYWTHKSFKAKLPLQLLLLLLQTIAFQKSVFWWARDHRSHHKYSETNADPHNAKRGFFFAHIGWLMSKRHPEVKYKGQDLDLSDLMADPLVRFQDKYYYYLMPLFCFILPSLIPTLWGESLWVSYHVCGMYRWVFVLHFSSLVNSATHLYGDKTFDKSINPGDIRGPVPSLFLLGENIHNYHHTFPWDYNFAKAGRFPYEYDVSALFIDAMSYIGWAYDLKTLPLDIAKQRALRTGDDTHRNLWGWDDKDITTEDIENTTIISAENNKDM